MTSILQTILGIGFLIFIHELGHYICARLAGIRVEVFSLGFGTRLFGFRRGDTEYRLSLVPLGGYVRVAGEDPANEGPRTDDSLQSKSVIARLCFFSGGVVMNLLFAFVAFPLVFRSGIDFDAPVVGQVIEGGPAWMADLRPGDRIVEVNSKPMYSFQNMRVEIALAGDNEVTLGVKRGDEIFSRTVRPTYNAERGWYAIGISGSIDPAAPSLNITPDSPASRAGMETGDLLLAIGGREVDSKSVGEILGTLAPEQKKATVDVSRDGKRLTFEVVPTAIESGDYRIGVYRLSRQVIGIRNPDSHIHHLELGDHIATIDGEPFTEDRFKQIADGTGNLRLEVLRADSEKLVVLEHDLTPVRRKQFIEDIGLGTDSREIAVTPLPGSPALAAGMKDGDQILRVNGKGTATWDDLRKAVHDCQGQELALDILRNREPVKISLLPTRSTLNLGFIPILKPLREQYKVDTFGGALSAGMVCSIDLIKQLYVTIKKLFTGEVDAKNLGGIITIARVSYDFAESGWTRFLYFLALLSLNLAFINVLPIPVLDGGHILFLAIEGIKGSPVSPRVFTYSQVAGLVFVIALIVFVTYNDILRLL